MQLFSSLSGAPVSVSAGASAPGAEIGSAAANLKATRQPVMSLGVVVELSPAAEALLEQGRAERSAAAEAGGNPLAPAGLSDAMSEVELFGPAADADGSGVFQIYENPAFEEAREAARSERESGGEASGAEAEAPTELSEDERAVVEKLKARDSAVRAHEMAHVAAAGGLAGAPSYSYQTGPDGKRYAIGGSVSIDTSAESSPEDTIAKAQRIRSAALAPADPSAQDRAVAARAARMESQARAAMAQEQAQEAKAALEGTTESMESVEQASGESSVNLDGPSAKVRPASVSSVIPGGIAMLATLRSASARLESPSLTSFSGGSAAMAQLYTPPSGSLVDAYSALASNPRRISA